MGSGVTVRLLHLLPRRRRERGTDERMRRQTSLTRRATVERQETFLVPAGLESVSQGSELIKARAKGQED